MAAKKKSEYDARRDAPCSIPVLIHVDRETGAIMAAGGEGVVSYHAVARVLWNFGDEGQVVPTAPKVSLGSAYMQGTPLKKDGTPRKIGPKWHFQEGEYAEFGVPPEGAWVLGSKISSRFALGEAGRALLQGALSAHDAISAEGAAALSRALNLQIQHVWERVVADATAAAS